MKEINIQILEDGDNYVSGGCGVSTYYYEISKEEFDRVKSIEGWQSKLTAEYEETMDDSIRYGYGFYGCGICESMTNGQYYFFTKIGNSCD